MRRRVLKALLLVGMFAAVLSPASAGEFETRLTSVLIGYAEGKVPDGSAKVMLVRFEFVSFKDPTFQVWPDPTGGADYDAPPVVEYWGCIEVKTKTGTDGDCRTLSPVEAPSMDAEPGLVGGSMTFTLPTAVPGWEGRNRIANVLMQQAGALQLVQALDFVPSPDEWGSRPMRIIFNGTLGLTRPMSAIGTVRSEVVGGGVLTKAKGDMDQGAHAFLDVERSKPLCVYRDINNDGFDDIPLPLPFNCAVETVEPLLP